MDARRVIVAGASGAGKTTLARRIAGVTGSPHIEIDGLYWRAGWTANESFGEEVAELVERETWVTEFQYREVLDALAARATLLVWLRPPRPVVLARVIRRTVRRRIHRELLWGVNVEPPLRTVLTDRDHIVRYSLRSFRTTGERIRGARRVNPALPAVEVRSRHDIDRLLRLLAA